uniref:Uncharacterized protein n=1 Tax=Oryza rufipogon TaxID=4529 RepID=A0A0E0Q3S2_ORYRU
MAGAAKGATFPPRSGAMAKQDLVGVEKELRFGSPAMATPTPTKGAKGAAFPCPGPGALVTLDLVPKKLSFDPLPGAAAVGGGEAPKKVVTSSPSSPSKNARLYTGGEMLFTPGLEPFVVPVFQPGLQIRD